MTFKGGIIVAEQLKLEDEKVKNSGMFYSDVVDRYNDGYFDSIEDFLEFLHDEDIKLTNENNLLWLCREE